MLCLAVWNAWSRCVNSLMIYIYIYVCVSISFLWVVCLNILITGAALALLPVGAFGGALCLPRNTATVFLKQKNDNSKKTWEHHPPEPKDQSLFWVSPGLFNFCRLRFLRRFLLLCLFLLSLCLLPFSFLLVLIVLLPKTGRQTNMAWLESGRSLSSMAIFPIRHRKSWDRSWWQNIPMKEGSSVHFPASQLMPATSHFILKSPSTSAAAWWGSNWHV